MEFPFEGIPTVPPRKDMEHFAFFFDGCRYRCRAGLAFFAQVPASLRPSYTPARPNHPSELRATSRRRPARSRRGCGREDSAGEVT